MFIEEEKEHMRTLDEAQRRRFLGTCAIRHGHGGISAASKFFGVSRNTVAAGVREVNEGYFHAEGTTRRGGGGRKKSTDKDPSIKEAIEDAIQDSIAGLPQDEKVRWIGKTVSQLVKRLADTGRNISRYIVSQVLKENGFRKRLFIKSLTAKESTWTCLMIGLLEESG